MAVLLQGIGGGGNINAHLVHVHVDRCNLPSTAPLTQLQYIPLSVVEREIRSISVLNHFKGVNSLASGYMHSYPAQLPRVRISLQFGLDEENTLYLVQWFELDLLWGKCFVGEWALNCIQVMCSYGNKAPPPATRMQMKYVSTQSREATCSS